MRDLIFVDQRGTGGSNPLTCPPPPEAADLMGRLFDLSRLAACRDQLARRADLRSYTTSITAGDYEAVLDALRYGQVNLWGVSYGTRLGLELLRRMPRRVRTLILEGAVPPSMAWPTYGARDADAALSALITDCEADAGCAANYPTFRHDVEAAFARLAPAPVATTVWDPHSRATSRVPFASSDLAYATRGLLYGAEALNLPRLFRAAASGRFDDFAQAYVTRARGLGQGVATGVHLGVYCAEDLPFVDLPAARALAARTRVGSYLLDQYRAACQIWPRAALPQGFHEPVRSDVPTLIMAGRRDPVTPPWTASSVAKALPRGRVLTWEAGGHGFDGLMSPACKQSIVEGFVTSAKADGVTTACMRRDRKLPFLAR
jgi:pimeloyl-ACP methyl ester carboxylesterase